MPRHFIFIWMPFKLWKKKRTQAFTCKMEMQIYQMMWYKIWFEQWKTSWQNDIDRTAFFWIQECRARLENIYIYVRLNMQTEYFYMHKKRTKEKSHHKHDLFRPSETTKRVSSFIIQIKFLVLPNQRRRRRTFTAIMKGRHNEKARMKTYRQVWRSLLLLLLADIEQCMF